LLTCCHSLSVKYHPDKHSGDKALLKKFEVVTQAYHALSDSDTRMLYDTYGSNFKEPEQDQMRSRKFGAQGKNMKLFMDDARIIQYTDANVDALDKGLKEPQLLFAYAPWQARSINMLKLWKMMPDLMDGVAKIGVVNCEANKMCREFGLQQLPAVLLFDPKVRAPKKVIEIMSGFLLWQRWIAVVASATRFDFFTRHFSSST
jgi:hypothetical protein